MNGPKEGFGRSMFKWKVSSLTSRGHSGGSGKKNEKNLNNSKATPAVPPSAQQSSPPPPTPADEKENHERDNVGLAPQTTFSPILPRSDGFGTHQAVPQQQPQQQQPPPTTNGHHYRSQAAEARQQQQPQPYSDGTHSWNEWTQQLLAYTAWVNSQLRKRPELPLVEDIGRDLQDGVLVAKLVEILTGKEIRGVEHDALTHQSKRDNFEKILTFLASQRVRTSTITSRDLATGNLKSLMRLILSLASHYKPHSVKQGRDSASHRGNAQATPNLNVPANRRFQQPGMENEEMDMKAVNAFATLRRQNYVNQSSAGTKRSALAAGSSANDLVMSPGVQRRFTMSSQVGREHMAPLQSSQLSPRVGFGVGISNARSLANLQQVDQQQQRPIMATSTSVGDLNTSEESDAARKPILKKDSKYGSRRELPALGVSGVAVMSKSRPSIFEFWENMLSQQPNSMDINPDAETNCTSRSSMRRVLPQLPGHQQQQQQPSSLTVFTNGNSSSSEPSSTSPAQPDMILGSRGEVEGSSNQPSPTCVANEIIDAGYWSQSNNNELRATTPVKQSQHDLLVEDLNRTKKQLAELQNMLLTSQQQQQQQEEAMTECKGTTTTSADPDAISWLRTTLHSVDQRCTSLQTDLKKAQQDCLTLDGSRRGLAACLANQEEALSSLRQELVRTNLVNQTMANEKLEIQRKLDEKDRQIADLRRQLAAKDRVMETQRAVLEEASQTFSPALRAKLDRNIGTIDARRNQYREELQVARDALSSLRSNFRMNDPNHHTLDTLEQCMAFLLERIAGPDSTDISSAQSAVMRQGGDSTLKRMASSIINGFHNEQFTKVVYFTERTVTPFLTVIPRRLGEICLRDFKLLFDRPGVYRFHFKAHDAEYGFVKEEIADDNMLLPGFDGKIIAWVEEIQV